MTPEKLDSFLRKITEHEMLYQNGWKNPQTVYEMATTTIKGKTLKVAPLSEQIPLLSCNKHSRFYAYPVHSHPWVELNYMYSGSCLQKINHNPVLLKQGQMLLLDQDTIHEVPVLGENDILLNIYIRKEYLTIGFLNRISQKNFVSQFLINAITEGLAHDSYIFFASEQSRRLPIFIKEFFCEYYDPSECSEDVMGSLFTLILSELIGVCRADAAALTLQSKKISTLPLLTILKYIEKHYQTITLNETAAFFGLNPDYLSRMLKAKMGSSFQTLITKQRMTAAQLLLTKSSLAINTIAQQIGYDNVTFFYKKFEETFGCSPGAYRKNAAEKEKQP